MRIQAVRRIVRIRGDTIRHMSENYEGPLLRSAVQQEFKMYIALPGVPSATAPVFNLYRDPRGENPQT